MKINRQLVVFDGHIDSSCHAFHFEQFDKTVPYIDTGHAHHAKAFHGNAACVLSYHFVVNHNIPHMSIHKSFLHGRIFHRLPPYFLNIYELL